MADVLTTLTALAVSVFRSRSDEGLFPNSLLANRWFDLPVADPVLREISRMAVIPANQDSAINEFANLALDHPDLAPIALRDGELDPMILTPGGGFRMSPQAIISALFSSAFRQMYFLRLPEDEGVFVRTVLEGFEELRRASRGERVRAYALTGFARITLPEGSQVSTRWGVVRPAPPVRPDDLVFFTMHQPVTTCILAEPRLLPVKFDRAPSPEHSFDPAEIGSDRARVLFALACALASRESSSPAVPLVTWSTLLLPFQSGIGFSSPHPVSTLRAVIDLGDRIEELEEWTRIVDRSHAPSVEIAAQRLISAVGHRLDRSDALIDAVMVWENLVGTTSEVTFRVTAALAKLLETDPAKRRDLRKSLADIYNIRSRVVHGAAVDAAAVQKACSDAIDVAVRALRASYRRGPEWLALSSIERADSILLEWE